VHRVALTAWGAEAGALPEIQTVETRAATPLRGTFRLAFRGQWTAAIPHDASAARVEAALAALPDVSEARVDRAALAQDAYRWTVTFIGTAGDIAPLVADASGLSAIASGDALVVVNEQFKGTSVPLASGSFALAALGRTQSLPWNASTAAMQAAYQALYLETGISVSRSGPDRNGGYEWLVTFPSAAASQFDHMEPVPDVSALAPATAVRCVVSSVQDGSTAGGFFQLTFGSLHSRALSHDATAQAVSDALAQDLGFSAAVSLDAAQTELGWLLRSWAVTFTDAAVAGEPALLGANLTGIAGTDKAFTPTFAQRGTQPLRGTFALSFSGEGTGKDRGAPRQRDGGPAPRRAPQHRRVMTASST
jgi:hypothetical protein